MKTSSDKIISVAFDQCAIKATQKGERLMGRRKLGNE